MELLCRVILHLQGHESGTSGPARDGGISGTVVNRHIPHTATLGPRADSLQPIGLPGLANGTRQASHLAARWVGAELTLELS